MKTPCADALSLCCRPALTPCMRCVRCICPAGRAGPGPGLSAARCARAQLRARFGASARCAPCLTRCARAPPRRRRCARCASRARSAPSSSAAAPPSDRPGPLPRPRLRRLRRAPGKAAGGRRAVRRRAGSACGAIEPCRISPFSPHEYAVLQPLIHAPKRGQRWHHDRPCGCTERMGCVIGKLEVECSSNGGPCRDAFRWEAHGESRLSRPSADPAKAGYAPRRRPAGYLVMYWTRVIPVLLARTLLSSCTFP
jgi:hypothetical protein